MKIKALFIISSIIFFTTQPMENLFTGVAQAAECVVEQQAAESMMTLFCPLLASGAIALTVSPKTTGAFENICGVIGDSVKQAFNTKYLFSVNLSSDSITFEDISAIFSWIKNNQNVLSTSATVNGSSPGEIIVESSRDNSNYYLIFHKLNQVVVHTVFGKILKKPFFKPIRGPL